jgi:putative membrane-bound dehydrogenase-like protein
MLRACFLLGVVLTGLSLGADEDTAAPIAIPRVLDDRLAIDLIAAEPEIVTPVAVVVDASGRVFAVESHTHFRPEGYPGPAADRILGFQDEDGDGKYERKWVAHEGHVHTMGLAFHPDGSLYVVTRMGVMAYQVDAQGKLIAPGKPIVHLETKADYPHNGFSGIAFDFAGNLYLGIGENLGDSAVVVGSDGKRIPFDAGDGGTVYAGSGDGSSLALHATGYWNPFALAFDPFERLFAVDNDPDSRPPCRLIWVVPDGDYGFRYRNGRRGTHPFTAWDGERPGTLPMISGTGEAPSGVVSYDDDRLPVEYQGALLVTSWGDHRLERHRPASKGAGLSAAAAPFVQGDQNFRPVGIARAPDGSLLVTDWVLRDYTLHRKGRLWRVRAKDAALHRQERNSSGLDAANRSVRESTARALLKEGEAGRQALRRLVVPGIPGTAPSWDARVRATAVAALATLEDASELGIIATKDPAPEVRALATRLAQAGTLDFLNQVRTDASPLVQAAALRRLTGPEVYGVVRPFLKSDDPFLTQAARHALARGGNPALVIEMSRDADPRLRLQALLTMRDLKQGQEELPRLLSDPDPAVRVEAVVWVAEDRLTAFKDALLDGFREGDLTRVMFESYLAALDRLERGITAYEREQPAEGIAARLANDDRLAPALRRRALRMVAPNSKALRLEDLLSLASQGDLGLANEAVRCLRERAEPEAHARLVAISQDAQQPESKRAEAIAGLTPSEPSERALLLRLAGEQSTILARQAMRSLRQVELSEEDKRVLEDLRTRADRADLVAMLLDPDEVERPARGDMAAWLAAVNAEPGDPAEGERLFHHPRGPVCVRCHAVDGRGGRVGPELSRLTATMTRERFLASILEPSREIAPQYVTWVIAARNGQVATGIILEQTDYGDMLLGDTEGKIHRVPVEEIVERKMEQVSIMPVDLEKSLSIRELRDVLAYILGPEPGISAPASPVPTQDRSVSPTGSARDSGVDRK